MSFSFKLGSKLVFTDGNNRYEVFVSDYSFSETFLESNYYAGSLHEPLAVDSVVINSKSVSTFNFSMNVSTGSVVEQKILEWWGCELQDGKQYLPVYKGSLNKTFDLYFVADSHIVKLEKGILENIGFRLTKGQALALEITGSASRQDIVSSIPEIGQLFTQTDFSTSSLLVSVDSKQIANLAGATVEITKSVNWINDNSVHTALSDDLYRNTQVLATGFALAGTISTHSVDAPELSLNSTIKINYGDYLEVYLNNVTTTDRLSVERIYTHRNDFKLLPASINSYIKF